jgi:hypothetical protein
MSNMASTIPVPTVSAGIYLRVSTPGMGVFQLRKGEEGISIFDPEMVDPPLTQEEVLQAFSRGSIIRVSKTQIVDKGLDER